MAEINGRKNRFFVISDLKFFDAVLSLEGKECSLFGNKAFLQIFTSCLTNLISLFSEIFDGAGSSMFLYVSLTIRVSEI